MNELQYHKNPYFKLIFRLEQACRNLKIHNDPDFLTPEIQTDIDRAKAYATSFISADHYGCIPAPLTVEGLDRPGLKILGNPGKQEHVEFRTTGEGPVPLFEERWVQFSTLEYNEMMRATATRLCVCYNALAGIPNPADLRESHARLLRALELVSIERDGPEGDLFPKARELGMLPGECSVETFVQVTIEDAIENARGVGVV